MTPDPLLVLIDGSNVTHRVAQATAIDVADSQRAFVDQLCSWGAGLGHEVVVTFDGAGPFGAGERAVTPDVMVVGTGADDADGVLELRARAARRAGQRTWLVTDDVALRRVAGAGADRMSTGAELLELIELDARQQREAIADPAPATRPPLDTRLADGLDADTRARLERLRRGDLT